MKQNRPNLADTFTGRGWAIFPCGDDKRPLTANGFKDATTDPHIIADWARQFPEHKIGLPCEPNGFFAVDVDPAGLETWHNWITEHGPTGAGPCQKTPRGGLHVLFKLPEGMKIPNKANALAEGIDLRSNGYICTGKGYAWQGGDHGPTAQLTEAPGWILDLIQQANAPKQKAEYIEREPINSTATGDYWLRRALENARPGNRNETGFKLACQLRDSGLIQPQAADYMRDYAARVPGADYDEGEALASLRQAYNETPREPATLPGEKRITMTTQEPINQPKNTAILPKKDTWEVISMAEAMQDRPPIGYAVAGLFELPSLNIVYGAPGCLKSFLLADMAACVANGAGWLQPMQSSRIATKATTRGPVMWLDLDNGKRRTQDRFKYLLQGHGFSAATPLYAFSNPNPPLNAYNPNDVEELILRVQNYGAQTIIIDNLGTITGEAEENSAEMARVMANLRRLAENTGAAVILIHHQRKGGANGSRAGDGLRGHSSIEASLDLALWMERETGSDTVTITPTKTRGADVDPFAAYFSYETDQRGNMKTARFFGYPCSIETERGLADWALEVLREALKTEQLVNQGRWIALLKEAYDGPHTMSETKARRLIQALENTARVKYTPAERNAKNYWPA